MSMTPASNKFNSREAGVSLMLAILVLSAITAVAFSLATIVFIEIRSAGDSLRSEPALYATLGVTEEALFQYKRYITPTDAAPMDVPNCEPSDGTRRSAAERLGAGRRGSHYDICSINGVTLTMSGDQPIAFDDSPRVEFLGAGITKNIPMYLADSFAKQYDSVQVEVLPNENDQSVEASFLVTTPTSTNPTAVPGVTVNPGQPFLYELPDDPAEAQYDLVLRNPSSYQDVSVSITTVRTNNAQPAGLPFIGEQVLSIVADYLGLTRTYQVRIPIP
jgi:hypothetical protein